MYKVVKYFTDLHDNEYPYNVGDIFPHEGIEVTEERLAELAGSDNKQGTPLIELVKDEEQAPVETLAAEPKPIPVEQQPEAPAETPDEDSVEVTPHAPEKKPRARKTGAKKTPEK